MKSAIWVNNSLEDLRLETKPSFVFLRLFPLLYLLDIILVQATVTKYHKLGGLYTTEIYFSQSWRLEVQDQGACKVRFLWGPSSRLQMASFLYPHRQREEASCALLRLL